MGVSPVMWKAKVPSQCLKSQSQNAVPVPGPNKMEGYVKKMPSGVKPGPSSYVQTRWSTGAAERPTLYMLE